MYLFMMMMTTIKRGKKMRKSREVNFEGGRGGRKMTMILGRRIGKVLKIKEVPQTLPLSRLVYSNQLDVT